MIWRFCWNPNGRWLRSCWWQRCGWGRVRFCICSTGRGVGGILVVWDSSRFCLDFLDILSHCVVIKGSWVVDSFSCGLMAVYAPCGKTEQFALWGELGLYLEERRDWAWCVAGDFNATRWASERRGCTSFSQGMNKFSEFVEESGLVDFPLEGKRFTWFGLGDRCNMIDRFLIANESIDRFAQIKQLNLLSLLSDHSPLLLVSSDEDWGPRPFRFLDCWLVLRV
ncbi:hypothetical protein GQ457_14G018570 [Hibiscus cannabinus]